MSHVFISHASADKDRVVRKLARDLTAVGHQVWYDEWTIGPGESLAEKIDEGIQECDYFIIVLSPSALRSRWVQKELNAAAVREIEKRAVFVVPIVIGSVRDEQIPVSLRSKKYVDMRRLTDSRYKLAFGQLIAALGDLQDIGHDEVPIFRCPRFLHKAANSAKKFYALSTLDIVCIENELKRDGKFDIQAGQALVFFAAGARRSEALRFRLDSEDRKRLSRKDATPAEWFTYEGENNENSVLKLQYQVGEKEYVSLYWINYAMVGYIEARAREFCHDWDFEVTLGRRHRKKRLKTG